MMETKDYGCQSYIYDRLGRKHLLMEIKNLGCQQEHVSCDAELMEDEGDGAPIIVMLWSTKGAFSYTLQICQFILQVPWVSVVVALEN
jgi:hypothetical protein